MTYLCGVLMSTTTKRVWFWLLSGYLAVGAAMAATVGTADHSKFEQLKKPFKSGPEVTKACLACHTEAANQVMHTSHWTWEYTNPANGQRLGKKTVLNNFCIATAPNLAFCTSCHAGYGWDSAHFDFAKQDNVDCLVCHDTTGKYRKAPGKAGHPAYQDMEFPKGSGKVIKAVDLNAVAQKVGKSSRDNCGACHFSGGGGDGVKHGDMDSSLAAPEPNVDVHMDAAGLDFSCATCHKTAGHKVPGSRYAPTAMDKETHIRGKADRNPATCQSCHNSRPHKSTRLNTHANKIACQTCHIPTIARGGVATKLSWDWSTAGKLSPEGKPITKKDSHGHVIYDSRKGDFVVGENVVPEYAWFNGQVKYTLISDKVVKGDKPTQINRFEGSATDGKSMIWPLKVFTGKQPYDPINQTLLVPHTAGDKGTGYWDNFNWDRALMAGMEAAGAPYSGQFDFIETEMSWPITHMVAPKKDALSCAQCHQPQSGVGRLDKVEGIYMPGRRSNYWLDLIGWLAAAGTLIGVSIHGAIRIYMARKNPAAGHP